MIRVAILSFWHVHAKDYAAEAAAHPETELVAVWDEEPERGRAEATTRGVPFEADLGALLARPDVDGVVVTAPTTMHREVLLAAAAAGKHIFAEKVIAPTERETREIVAAVEAAGVPFVVALPRLGSGSTLAIRGAIAEGAIGEPTLVRVRIGHNGALRTAHDPEGWLPARFFDPAQAAGGVLIDLGCHPLYLTRLFLGLPETVGATYGRFTGRAVEDNAVVSFGYANGALGVVEASFVEAGSAFAIEAHGTAGSLVFGPPDNVVRFRPAGERGAASPWTVRHQPADLPSPFAQWVDHVRTGTTAPENVAAAVDLSALAEAANRAAAEGRAIPLSSLAAE